MQTEAHILLGFEPKISGTWLVRNSSDVKDSESCAYVKINTTRTGAVLSYDSKKIPTVELTIFNSTSNLHIFTETTDKKGNMTFILLDLPNYIVLNSTSAEIPTYLILTGPTAIKIDGKIKKKLDETADLKNITFYPTGQDTESCKKYIKDEESGPTETNINSTTFKPTTIKPMTIKDTTINSTTVKSTTSKSKNSGSSLIVSNLLVVLISLSLIISK
ncbi:uncharacterized protein LOC123675438 isoform X2 [Harmonia axyridis]|uniref:uncharacterized protein LOC123675438 isoform X2 n=1 Tax=Harmonia axyridis TaxID=115357 RepID=UPI001E279A2E|nr:uncharacterized protein LOC123675438 isoform X2 [Harmonia axyridis]